MSVLDNVMVGAERPGNSASGAGSGLERYAMAALDFVGLAARADEMVPSLSYGHQRLVEIARALAGNPKVLLLDEPGAGLNHVEKAELVTLLKRLKGHGLTICVIDHDMHLVEQVADHITVLNFGKRIAEGTPMRCCATRWWWRPTWGRSGAMPLLELNGVVAAYGKVEVLKSLTLTVEQGEIVALLGANGAGKSTTLRTISGLMKPQAGAILLESRPIAGLSPEAIVRLGVAHVPEGRRVFPGLTVRENIVLGGSNCPVRRGELEADAERMLGIFPEIKPFENALGWTLSGGQQQMVAIARGLMSKPKLLLLDEPSLGLAPLIMQQVYKVISEIRRQRTTVLLVEQNAHMALSVADRGYVLETGRLVVEGKPEALWDNEEVRAAYLGGRKA